MTYSDVRSGAGIFESCSDYIYVLVRSVKKLELAFPPLFLTQPKYISKIQKCVIYFTWWTNSVASIDYWQIDKK